MLVQTEAMITSLVFDHALRIRIKAETAESPSASRATSVATTPDNASIAEASEDATAHGSPSGSTASEEETVRASTFSTASTAAPKKGKEPAKKVEEQKPAVSPSAGSGNLVGKLNNLVTTDLNNLVEGRDFLFVGEHLAVDVIACDAYEIV